MDIQCKYCNSPNIVKYGTYEGIQRYWCKDCKRKTNKPMTRKTRINKRAKHVAPPTPSLSSVRISR